MGFFGTLFSAVGAGNKAAEDVSDTFQMILAFDVPHDQTNLGRLALSYYRYAWASYYLDVDWEKESKQRAKMISQETVTKMTHACEALYNSVRQEPFRYHFLSLVNGTHPWSHGVLNTDFPDEIEPYLAKKIRNSYLKAYMGVGRQELISQMRRLM